jgi:hypothetical protein
VFLAALVVWPLRSESAVDPPSPWPLRIAAATALMFFASFATQVSALMNIPESSPQRVAAQCVGDLAQREGVSAVLGEYWVVKPLMLFSDGRAHMVQVMPSLQPNYWIVSRGWFRAPRVYGMVITNGLDTRRVEKLFGRPDYTTQCETYGVMVYRGLARARMTFMMQGQLDRSLLIGDLDRKIGWRDSD